MEIGATFWHGAYREHGGAVLAFLASRLGRREDAEDLLQETFVKAIRSGQLRDTDKVKPYLFSIAHRLTLNHFRKRRERLFSEESDGVADLLGRLEDGARPTPEAEVVGRDLAARVRGVLDGLPEAHRAAFEAAVLQRRSYREIAERHGWTLAQVKTNVFRARRRVIADLGPALGERGAS